jgi:hypothetical protein
MLRMHTTLTAVRCPTVRTVRPHTRRRGPAIHQGAAGRCEANNASSGGVFAGMHVAPPHDVRSPSGNCSKRVVPPTRSGVPPQAASWRGSERSGTNATWTRWCLENVVHVPRPPWPPAAAHQTPSRGGVIDRGSGQQRTTGTGAVQTAAWHRHVSDSVDAVHLRPCEAPDDALACGSGSRRGATHH